MSIRARFTVALLFLIVCSVSQAQTFDLDAILQRLVSSYGGETSLRKLDSQIQVWDIVAIMGNRHGSDIRTIRGPQQLKVELNYHGKMETRILNGSANYVFFSGAPPQIAVSPQLDAMRLQQMRLYSPLVLRDKIESLSFAMDGETCTLTLFENGVRADYLVNMKNWRIESFVGGLAIKGHEMQFVTQYSNFAFHDGVLMHQVENKFAGGVKTAVLKLRQIMLNAEIEDADFLPGSADEPVNPHRQKGPKEGVATTAAARPALLPSASTV
jgi:hypothetical protein